MKLLNPSIPKAKYVGVMLMKMTILVMENASLPVTKKQQNMLPESQLVTKKHRCFFVLINFKIVVSLVF